MTKNLEQEARDALRIVGILGIDLVKRSEAHRPHLQYGLEHGVFNQSEVDKAELQYLEKTARDALDAVRSLGMDWVKTGKVHSSNLQYGLDHKLFDQSEVDKAELQYLEKTARNALRTVGILGVDWVKGSEAHRPHLQYGLDEGFFTQSEVDGAQSIYDEAKAE